MAENNTPHSLNNKSADQIRNQQRGGDAGTSKAGEENGPEGNATLRRAWDEAGGDADAYRQAVSRQDDFNGDHSELTAAETPETTKHLSDASLSPEDRDATAEAIHRASTPEEKGR
jgi:hypothetical protein